MILQLIALLFAVIIWDFLLRFIKNYLLPNVITSKPFFSDKKYRFSRKAALNIITVLCVLILIHVFQSNSHFMKDEKDKSLDFLLSSFAKILPHQFSTTNIPSTVFLDIDQETYNDFGQPVLMPKKPLKNLIGAAADGGAKVIIVDVNLKHQLKISSQSNSERVEDQIKEGKVEELLYKELYSFLENYQDKYCVKSNSCPTILLYQSIYPRQCPSQQTPCYIFKNKRLDTIVHNSYPYIQWGMTRFLPSNYDDAIRRWKLWDITCDDNGNVNITGSMQLLTSILIAKEFNPESTTPILQNILKRYDSENYCNNKKLLLTDTGSLNISESLKVSLEQDTEQQYIRYFIPYSQNTDLLPPLVKKVSAKDYINYSADHFQSSIGIFKDSIVVIGGSYIEGMDIHKTPLGDMPGAIIIINAIYSLLLGEVQPAPIEWYVVLWIGIIAFIVIVFTRCSSFFSMLLFGTALGLIVATISIILFYYWGWWFNFITPLVVLHIHQIIMDFNEYHNNRNNISLENL